VRILSTSLAAVLWLIFIFPTTASASPESTAALKRLRAYFQLHSTLQSSIQYEMESFHEKTRTAVHVKQDGQSLWAAKASVSAVGNSELLHSAREIYTDGTKFFERDGTRVLRQGVGKGQIGLGWMTVRDLYWTPFGRFLGIESGDQTWRVAGAGTTEKEEEIAIRLASTDGTWEIELGFDEAVSFLPVRVSYFHPGETEPRSIRRVLKWMKYDAGGEATHVPIEITMEGSNVMKHIITATSVKVGKERVRDDGTWFAVWPGEGIYNVNTHQVAVAKNSRWKPRENLPDEFPFGTMFRQPHFERFGFVPTSDESASVIAELTGKSVGEVKLESLRRTRTAGNGVMGGLWNRFFSLALLVGGMGIVVAAIVVRKRSRRET
jgi:hypothetical protein